ncbi:MAG: hypothetical protein VX737_06555 [Pseudomonadota bacterium]|nr:hypothetical protein [Pseudomonadota bacterium]
MAVGKIVANDFIGIVLADWLFFKHVQKGRGRHSESFCKIVNIKVIPFKNFSQHGIEVVLAGRHKELKM